MIILFIALALKNLSTWLNLTLSLTLWQWHSQSHTHLLTLTVSPLTVSVVQLKQTPDRGLVPSCGAGVRRYGTCGTCVFLVPFCFGIHGDRHSHEISSGRSASWPSRLLLSEKTQVTQTRQPSLFSTHALHASHAVPQSGVCFSLYSLVFPHKVL